MGKPKKKARGSDVQDLQQLKLADAQHLIRNLKQDIEIRNRDLNAYKLICKRMMNPENTETPNKSNQDYEKLKQTAKITIPKPTVMRQTQQKNVHTQHSKES